MPDIRRPTPALAAQTSAWQRFRTAQDGAVTVDWTVLTAAIVGFGIAAAALVRTGIADLGEDVRISLSNATVGRLAWRNAGITNGICPGEDTLRAMHAALVAGGETFADLVGGNATGEWDLTVWSDWLRYSEQNGFSADEFVTSYDWWQSDTGPGNPGSREFQARFFACVMEADPRDWSQQPGGSFAGYLMWDFGFQLPGA